MPKLILKGNAVYVCEHKLMQTHLVDSSTVYGWGTFVARKEDLRDLFELVSEPFNAASVLVLHVIGVVVGCEETPERKPSTPAKNRETYRAVRGVLPGSLRSTRIQLCSIRLQSSHGVETTHPCIR